MIKLEYKKMNSKQLAIYTRAKEKINLITILTIKDKDNDNDHIETVKKYLNNAEVNYTINKESEIIIK